MVPPIVAGRSYPAIGLPASAPTRLSTHGHEAQPKPPPAPVAGLEGILNAVVLGVTNARSEAVNAKIQWIKYTARRFQNRELFRNAIYFHLGGLVLSPGLPSK